MARTSTTPPCGGHHMYKIVKFVMAFCRLDTILLTEGNISEYLLWDLRITLLIIREAWLLRWPGMGELVTYITLSSVKYNGTLTYQFPSFSSLYHLNYPFHSQNMLNEDTFYTHWLCSRYKSSGTVYSYKLNTGRERGRMRLHFLHSAVSSSTGSWRGKRWFT